MNLKRYVLVGIISILTINLSAKEYNVADFGAINDGQTINTKSIQLIVLLLISLAIGR
jgi:polygalacturonase